MSAPPKGKGALLHAPIPVNSVPKIAALPPEVKQFPAIVNSNRFQSDTYGPPGALHVASCAWRVLDLATELEFSRKLEKREDARRVEISRVNHFRRTFELRGTWRKVRRIIDRYLVSAGGQFSGNFRPQVASKTAGVSRQREVRNERSTPEKLMRPRIGCHCRS